MDYVWELRIESDQLIVGEMLVFGDGQLEGGTMSDFEKGRESLKNGVSEKGTQTKIE